VNTLFLDEFFLYDMHIYIHDGIEAKKRVKERSSYSY